MQINGIDAKDNQIVSILRENARMSCTDIGKKVGLSRTAVKNRISALEESGIIKGYSAIIDPHASPEMLTFVAIVETELDAYDKITEALQNEKCVVTLCQVTGECKLHAICVVESLNEMQRFAWKMRNNNSGLKKFAAQMVMQVMKGSVLSE